MKTLTVLDLSRYLVSLRDIILSNDLSLISNTKKDISLLLDKFLNEKIQTFLKDNSSYPILSEEDGNQKSFTEYNDYFWIIDPLDGTLNHSRSIPISCISIALWHKNMPIAGIIYDFNKDEMYVGVCRESEFSDKKGAWLNKKAISVSEIDNKNRGVICTGFPSWRDYSTDSIINFVKKVQKWKKVRLIGSAAISLAWVAAGRTDGYMEEDIRIWDVAAGIALVKASGGEVFYKSNERPNFVNAIVTNGKISIEDDI